MKKKCYIYTRVSTAAQTEGYSLEAQQERLRQYAEYKNLEIAGEYCDAGKSGKSILGRPAFMEMMDDIASGKDQISYVLVFKLSRFGRNAADVLKSIQTLLDYDVDLVCVEDSIDSSTQGGRLTLAILSAVAEIERENIRVQFMAGRLQKMLEGGWAGGPAPFGYRNKNGKLTVEPGEAEIVRLIYAKYLEPDMKLATVVRWLNDHGYRRISRGSPCPYNRDFAARVLDNPFYCGKIVYYRRTNRGMDEQNQRKEITVRGKQEAIIPEEMWDRVQEKRKEMAVHYEKDEPDRISMLSGLVKCPLCGAGMVMQKNKRINKNRGGYYKPIYYYACRNYRKSEGRRCSFKHTYNQSKLDGAVLEILGQLTRTEEFRNAFAAAIGDQSSEASFEGQLKDLRRRLHSQEHLKYKLGQELDRLDVLKDGYDETYDAIQERIDAVYDRIERLETEIGQVRRKLTAFREGLQSSGQISRILDHIDRLYRKMSCAERRELCRQFIERIEVFPEEQKDGRILKSIAFRFPVFYGEDEAAGEPELPDETVAFVLDCRKLPVTVPEAKATYAEIKAYVLEKSGLKVSSLYIAQIKRKYGIEMGENYNKPEEPKARVPKCPKEKELAILDALKNFRMVPETAEYEEAEA